MNKKIKATNFKLFFPYLLAGILKITKMTFLNTGSQRTSPEATEHCL